MAEAFSEQKLWGGQCFRAFAAETWRDVAHGRTPKPGVWRRETAVAGRGRAVEAGGEGGELAGARGAERAHLARAAKGGDGRPSRGRRLLAHSATLHRNGGGGGKIPV